MDKYSFEKDINEIIKIKCLDNVEYNINKIIATGSNLFGDLFTVDIQGERNGEKEEINLFLKKQVTQNFDLYDIYNIPIKDLFSRETFVYTELFKMYDEIQNDASIPKNEQIKFPKFYDTNDIHHIIMDNLYKTGFKDLDRRTPINIEYAKLSIDQLAKLHALSYVTEAKMPQYFGSIKEKLKPVMVLDGERKVFMKRLCKTALEAIKSEDAKKKYREKVYDRIDALGNYIDGRWNNTKCICHGDFKISNTMCKFDCKGAATDVIILDFQMMHIGHPLIDFFYFIFGATDKSFRATHMQFIKEYYFEKLSEKLDKFDLDINKFYPKDIFEADYNNMVVDVGLVLAAQILPYNLSPENDVLDFTNPVISDNYIVRMNDLVQDVIDWGYL